MQQFNEEDVHGSAKWGRISRKQGKVGKNVQETDPDSGQD